MLSIDGSYGEGGGQILRTAIALSVLTKKPVEITNIRARRPSPGIKPQHHAAVTIIKNLCSGKTEGLDLGSSHIRFYPKDIKGGEHRFDIGTAGSITLVLQACILASLKTTKPVTIKIIGGTDVKWAPSWDYFTNIFLPLIKKMGVKTDTQLIRRGYYPQGGGEAILKIYPTKEIFPLHLKEKQIFKQVNGIIHLSKLPDHIGKRMKHAAIKTLLKKNIETHIHVEKTTDAFSEGTGITLWSQSSQTTIGSTMLGEKGVPAEKIGEEAATQLIKEIESGATIDIYAADQIIPYMVLAREKGESSCIVRKLTDHTKTNIWLLQQFFDTKIKTIKQKNNTTQLIIK